MESSPPATGGCGIGPARAAAREGAWAGAQAPRGGSPTRPAATGSLSPMARILVIDDEPLVRDAVRGLLEFAGHEVSEAVDGVEGADLFRRHPCDLVLCDLYMPRESGL